MLESSIKSFDRVNDKQTLVAKLQIDVKFRDKIDSFA